MTEMTPFLYGDQPARVVERDGEPWWVATDVAAILGYRSASDATRSLDDDEKGYAEVRTPGGTQNVVIVSESGLYTLIFRSKAETVREFRRWVTHEVLPSVRKTGGYQLPDDPQARAAITRDRAGTLASLVRGGLVDRETARELARRDLEATYGPLPDAPPPPDPAAVAKAKTDALRAEILKTIAADPGLTTNGIHALIPHNKNTVLRALHAAVADGAVRVENGRSRSRRHYIADAPVEDAR